ncbi:MAG: phosphoglycerate kinase [Candidatus Zambryskibacteria bacterium]|nr:phosphoglycerate kinase [Candidatus Zambryskibacteria bacterium]
MISIKDAGNLKDKRVLVRVDWSVPMDGGKITNDFQIKATLPTLNYLHEAGTKVIVATHLESINDSIESLKVYLPEGMELLPNLRENPGEESNTEEFAKDLAFMADIYVNDAFSVSHREHASIVGVPKLLPSFAGLRFMEEVEHLSKALSPAHPFLFILGGAKFETKMPLVEKFLNIADSIFIAGANAKPAFEIFKDNPKVIFPVGDIAALDADEEVIHQLAEKIENSEFILWNGPLGKYEDGLKEGTLALAKLIADSGKQSIVGGGDTLSAINELGSLDKFTFVSTGGGAMLDFLATETLPGIEALN